MSRLVEGLSYWWSKILWTIYLFTEIKYEHGSTVNWEHSMYRPCNVTVSRDLHDMMRGRYLQVMITFVFILLLSMLMLIIADANDGHDVIMPTFGALKAVRPLGSRRLHTWTAPLVELHKAHGNCFRFSKMAYMKKNYPNISCITFFLVGGSNLERR